LATQVLKIIHEDLNQPFVYSYSNKALRKRFFLAWDMPGYSDEKDLTIIA